MTRIANFGDRSKLENLNLETSANFEADETVEKLADILSAAPYFKNLNIISQRGSRQVNVEIQYACEEVMGSIQLSNKETNEIICTKETVKT